MSLKPIKVWGHWGAPNPWKVRMILEELELPYDFKTLELPEAKSPEHLAVNPNGRLPTIEDPNTGITLWESGAIILYLIDRYDADRRISYGESPEKYLTQQWLAFQISGQGPYFGQATWFARFHPEKIPSAIERYTNEIERVMGVLELGLERNGTGWLVGDKCSYADIAFVTWNMIGEGVLQELNLANGLSDKYPRYSAWYATLKARPHIKKALEDIAEQRKAHGLP